MMIAPVFMGFAMVYFFHSYVYLAFTVLSPVMGFGNWISGRRGGRKEFLRSVANYRLRRASLESDVRGKVDTERRIRVASSPDPAVVGMIAAGPGARLWERRRSDPDNLVLRIGTNRQRSLLQIDDGAREDNHRTTFWQIPDMPSGGGHRRQQGRRHRGRHRTGPRPRPLGGRPGRRSAQPARSADLYPHRQ